MGGVVVELEPRLVVGRHDLDDHRRRRYPISVDHLAMDTEVRNPEVVLISSEVELGTYGEAARRGKLAERCAELSGDDAVKEGWRGGHVVFPVPDLIKAVLAQGSAP